MRIVPDWRERAACRRDDLKRQLAKVERRAALRLLLGEAPHAADANAIQHLHTQLAVLSKVEAEAERIETEVEPW